MSIVILFTIVFLVSFTLSIHAQLYQSNYGQYQDQGIPFRENSVTGNRPILREYDFIVIGAGAGGCVVANRLSEQPNWSVLLLEAGPDETLYTDIPGATELLQKTNYDWGYTSEPVKNGCLGYKNKRCPWPKGKGMGGSSTINALLYTRGVKEDYDTIAAQGNSGWAYKDVLPYFLKSENNSIPEYQNSPFHSQKGNVHVERAPYRSPIVDMFIEAGVELGLQKDIDYTINQEYGGISRSQITTINGRRVSASKAYIHPAKDRQNLHVAIFSQVTRILIDPKTKKTLGVEFIKKGQIRTVYSKKEVILSSGPINSPQLLMLSGIGPKEHLKHHGIRVIQDLPVGQNLHEHYGLIGLEFIVNQTGPVLTRKSVSDPHLFDEWYKYGRGPLTLPEGREGVAYVRSPAGKQHELVLTPVTNKPNVFYVNTFLLQPDNRGRVTLKNNNSMHAPIMSFDYYDNSTDLEENIFAVKYAVKFVENTRAFQGFAAKLNPVPYPKCSHLQFRSDNYWACVLVHMTGTSNHHCGTCRMGDVVNEKLQVIGIYGLRVVDSSVFPHIPSTHMYAPTMMVGEKGADMIRSYWSQ
ncbi:glucose dehydrogenase [FAD, quinone]-like [Acyrthosiphon pisum]|uniref:Glucose-methanol-choline oxidoreductase N-terminal domain-containing protein n=1 Tax=Acyrthosiphon pisum TaxID=7029 RepID=A0A8R2H5Z6_ACYPI|nr:glucose dehydrogenase [FAD, quinone]-like [Acyrthosiphon pisum]|eukprot:XP_016661906.1 PREDICTED: glucose dehydrogenase [FAD, quinone]-like [Acyrthosiphon pisum]